MNQSEESLPVTEKEREFARELARSLQHVDAPPGFADRTLARIESAAAVRPKVVEVRRMRAWLSGAIAASVLVGAVFAGELRLHRQQARAEVAQRQFEAGLRITDQTLQHARERLQHSGIRIGN